MAQEMSFHWSSAEGRSSPFRPLGAGTSERYGFRLRSESFRGTVLAPLTCADAPGLLDRSEAFRPFRGTVDFRDRSGNGFGAFRDVLARRGTPSRWGSFEGFGGLLGGGIVALFSLAECGGD